MFCFHSSHGDYETGVTSEDINHMYKNQLYDSSRRIPGYVKLKDTLALW